MPGSSNPSNEEIRQLIREIREDERNARSGEKNSFNVKKSGSVFETIPEIPLTIATTIGYFLYKVKTRPFNAYSGYWLDVRVKTQTLLVFGGLFFHFACGMYRDVKEKVEKDREEMKKTQAMNRTK